MVASNTARGPTLLATVLPVRPPGGYEVAAGNFRIKLLARFTQTRSRRR